jgi:hypothetical protein
MLEWFHARPFRIVRLAQLSMRTTISRRILLGFLSLAISTLACDRLTAADESAKVKPYPETIIADHPVAYWRFEDGKLSVHPQSLGADKLKSGKIVGEVAVDQSGPGSDRFPAFETSSRAVALTKPGAIAIADPGEQSPLDFDLGDAITLEAWVQVTQLSDGQQMYVVGKGRTKNKDVAAENQNYALRLAGIAGSARLSFLFRDVDNRPGNKEDYHRWNSTAGFAINDGWHHIAVSYIFGKPESIRGYIDGRSTEGTWDYGGASPQGPVVDNDALWIGSALGLNQSNSFRGSIDEVAIYRTALSPERIAAHWRVVEAKPYVTNVPIPDGQVLVEVFEKIPDQNRWTFVIPEPTERFIWGSFFFPELVHKYTPRGVRGDRTNPHLFRASADVTLPSGPLSFLIRSRSMARLFIDDKPVVANPFPKSRSDGHNDVYDIVESPHRSLRPLRAGDQETTCTFEGDGKPHRMTFEVLVGGGKRRIEMGETLVAISPAGQPYQPLNVSDVRFDSTATWDQFESTAQQQLAELNRIRRHEASREYAEYWRQRHAATAQKLAATPGPIVPKLDAALPVNNDIDRFIGQKLESAKTQPTALTDDWSFVRRVSLDILGRLPKPAEIEHFLSLDPASRRSRFIDELLKSPDWADHWVGYWQDVLAENPNIINPTLNNTGPFRWWIHESFADNKPFDRFATELILMEGSVLSGGTGGFAMASQNDAPMAAKAHIISQAFLGMEMKCARCHDAPYHDFTQKELFSVAAMLGRGPQSVPKTSTIPGSEDAIKSLLVKVTLKPGQEIPPEWPFAELVNGDTVVDMLQDRTDRREQLAALVTSGDNHRFAQVIVNRLWQRYFGRGLVQPVDDWEHPQPSHPDLLAWLERELVTSGYDLKHVARLILNSHAYQRQPVSGSLAEGEKSALFAGPLRRRMSAEQLVDSLFAAAGKPMNVETINIDVDGGRRDDNSINLGTASRAWHFTSMSNERDRPSLSLPAAQTVVNLLEAFGWRGSRQDPLTIRAQESTALQPAVLANGVVAKRISQLSDDSEFTRRAISADKVETFVDDVFHAVLTRQPTDKERATFVELLQNGFDRRITSLSAPPKRPHSPNSIGVSWSNHLKPAANERKTKLAEELEQGDPPTDRLAADWRERAEDMIWTLINSPEFVLVP